MASKVREVEQVGLKVEELVRRKEYLDFSYDLSRALCSFRLMRLLQNTGHLQLRVRHESFSPVQLRFCKSITHFEGGV